MNPEIQQALAWVERPHECGLEGVCSVCEATALALGPDALRALALCQIALDPGINWTPENRQERKQEAEEAARAVLDRLVAAHREATA